MPKQTLRDLRTRLTEPMTLTLETLASRAECSVTTLARAERGERALSLALKERLAVALGVSVDMVDNAFAESKNWVFPTHKKQD